MAGERLTLKAELFCASVRDGTHDSPKPASGGKYLVTSRHIIGGKVDLSNAYLISQEDFDNINKRSKVDKWDVLISMIGTVGEVCLVKEEPDFAIKNIGLFKAKGEIEGKWLYYYLQSPQAKQHMLEQSRGTTQAYIPLGSLRVFPILIPENKKEMQAIAHILGTLDDKIELNRKMNKTLEEMARAIFKSWFVDFDPLHAKAAVRRDHPNWTNAQVSRAALPNLSPEIAELFPDSFEDSELGKIPKGWKSVVFEEIVTAKQGKYLPNEEMSEFPTDEYVFPVWGGNGTRGYAKQKMYDDPIVILTCRGSNCGLINLTESNVWTSNIVFACEPKLGSTNYIYVYFNLCSFVDCISGSAQPQITYTALKNKRMPFPISSHICNAFSNVIEPLFKKIFLNDGESNIFVSIRDKLLPKLISGELRIPDAEKIVKRYI